MIEFSRDPDERYNQFVNACLDGVVTEHHGVLYPCVVVGNRFFGCDKNGFYRMMGVGRGDSLASNCEWIYQANKQGTASLVVGRLFDNLIRWKVVDVLYRGTRTALIPEGPY